MCIAAALRFHDGEGVDQYELFEYLDETRSVSDAGEGEGELTHISKILPSVLSADDLPF